jgi:hypothetical protein
VSSDRESSDRATSDHASGDRAAGGESGADRTGTSWPLGEWLRGDWLRGDWAGGDWPLVPWLGDRSGSARTVGGVFSFGGRERGTTNPGPASGTAPPGTEALQAAALQAISAAKAFLDLAERAVHDPEVVGHVASVVGAAADGVLGSLGSFASGLRASRRDEDDPPLEHIDLD